MTSHSRKTSTLERAAGVALLVLAFAAFWFSVFRDRRNLPDLSPYRPLDDAYMFIRYADNLLAHHWFAWNENGKATYGCTSLGYLVLVTLLRAILPLSETGVLQCASLLGATAFLALVGWFTWRELSQTSLGKGIALQATAFVLAVLCSQSEFVFHSLTGMETTWSMTLSAAVAISLVDLYRRSTIAAGVRVAVLGFLFFTLRPESLLFTGAAAAMVLVLPRGPKAAIKLPALRGFAIALAALLAVDTIWKTAVFGSPLPLPFFVKAGGAYQGYAGYAKWNMANYLITFLRVVWPFAVVIAVFVRRSSAALVASLCLPVLLVIAFFFTTLPITGNSARYLMPSVAPLVVCAVVALRELAVSLPADLPALDGAWARIAAVTILFLCFQHTVGGKLATAYEKGVLDRRDAKAVVEKRDSVFPEMGWASSLRAMVAAVGTMPITTHVAATEVGLLSARYPHLYLTDLSGLNDRDLAHHFSPAVVFAGEPDLIWMPHEDYTVMRKQLENDPQMTSRYLYLNGLFDYGVAVRRDGTNHKEVASALARSIEETYHCSGSIPCQHIVDELRALP